MKPSEKQILEEHSHLEAHVGVTVKIEGCRVLEHTIRELETHTKVEMMGRYMTMTTRS